MMGYRLIEGLYKRVERARALVQAGKVSPVVGLEGVYVVLNGDGNAHYLVNAGSSCTCPDFEKHGGKYPCKHILAVELYQVQQQQSQSATEPVAPSQASPQARRNGQARRQAKQEPTEEFAPVPILNVENVYGSLTDPD
ncbi:MAG: SWIM zinc finger family protein [Candidatus Methanomethylicaceae archaeon]